MTHTYEYNGFTLQVAIESAFRPRPRASASARGYVAVVRICDAQTSLPRFSPLRLDEFSGRPFASEKDALTGGYSAARTIVDDLFG
ncbi:hypothetical protein [Burkholderia sp. Ac-20365]|jgi:hypothetical protein|uniref:hypothetical protein n=1 Tax=Burkholderia sp. Ac-20365 TaxID=2703897 RepID=UPI00197BB52F|nr:hypothetical protein [Burkholderia sp. Ac-20365]MBN3762280.1 hypothetical protein [Burkholderia sp. Ac-20365]